jgi:hypothetical protein
MYVVTDDFKFLTISPERWQIMNATEKSTRHKLYNHDGKKYKQTLPRFESFSLKTPEPNTWRETKDMMK